MIISQNISLKKMNTFNIDVKTSEYCEVNTLEDVMYLSEKEYIENGFLVLGGGSNLLFTSDYEGLLIKNNIKGKEIVSEDAESIILKAGSGEVWDEFVNYCVENNWYGVENLSLIPGSVGAAPIQNIGAYGIEMKDILESVEYFDTVDKRICNILNENCNFGYRNSIFKNKLKNRAIILSVNFRLSKQKKFNLSYRALQSVFGEIPEEDITISEIRKKIIEIRESKLPSVDKYGNAGSFFKNPEIKKEEFERLQKIYPEIVYFTVSENRVKIPAGWLIEKAGLKGFRKGNVGTYENQALVIVNYGGVKGIEIKEFAEEIIKKIKDKFRIELIPEVNII